MKVSKKHWLQLVALAALGGLGSWVIGNYETLVPYRWQQYSTADGKFSMGFPGKPLAQDEQRAIAGDEKIRVHVVGTETSDGYYSFAYIDTKNAGDKSPDDLLD